MHFATVAFAVTVRGTDVERPQDGVPLVSLHCAARQFNLLDL
jgi:hypothetical protein